MSIKAKLIANALLIAALIGAITLSSYLSMGFLQEKLTRMTEHSVPFQFQTVELQRELQKCIATLIRVHISQSFQEYTAIRKEAEKSLSSVADIQRNLRTLNHHALQKDVLEELDKLALELFNASEERIHSSVAAIEANKSIQLKLLESTKRLSLLEQSIQSLQNHYAKAFTQSLATTSQLSAKLRSIEELRNLVRELQMLDITTQNSQKKSAILIAKGKLKAVSARITKNDYYKSNMKSSSLNTGFSERLLDYIKLLSVNIDQKELELNNKRTNVSKDISSKLNDLFQTLDQDSILAQQELNVANNRQGAIYEQSVKANKILKDNSELVSYGLMVSAETNRFFACTSDSEIKALDSKLRTLFTNIFSRIKTIEYDLAFHNNYAELVSLQAATNSLASIQQEIYRKDGLVFTISQKLSAIKQAEKTAETLRDIVAKQTIVGKESITQAQNDQDKSVVAVSSAIRNNLIQNLLIGLTALLVGLLFSVWMYRSVLLPLHFVLKAIKQQHLQATEKALLATAVASGDLDQEVPVGRPLHLDLAHVNNDEVGNVLNAVVAMSEAQVTLDNAFVSMTESLRKSRQDEQRRDHVKNGLFELNRILRNEQTTEELSNRTLTFIANFVHAGVGLLYGYNNSAQTLELLAGYALSQTSRYENTIYSGAGLIGQVAQGKKKLVLQDVPRDYIKISSALGTSDPHTVAILPILHNDDLIGIMELGSFSEFTSRDYDFLDPALEEIAIALKINRARTVVDHILRTSRQQSELNFSSEISGVSSSDQS